MSRRLLLSLRLVEGMSMLAIMIRSPEMANEHSSPYVPKHGELIGWRAKYSSEHIIRNMDEEVEFILENVNDKHRGLR